MVDNYKRLKSRRRVSFHLGACSILFLICSIIAKELIISLILSFAFLLSLIVYIHSLKNMNKIENKITNKCINCDNNVSFKEETKYLLYGQNVSERDFNTNITTEKRKTIIKKYFCVECKLCFTIIEFYQMNNKGNYSLIKKEKHLIEDFNENC